MPAKELFVTAPKAKLTSRLPCNFFVDRFWAAVSTLNVRAKYPRLLMLGSSEHSFSTHAGKCILNSLEPAKRIISGNKMIGVLHPFPASTSLCSARARQTLGQVSAPPQQQASLLAGM